eukprot:TRINITY_DN8150_c0_g1_i1.p1 TRINITY_DN8150_c0_g1~~TRINITY_DN8150_c0_g1_i1.p1  ORF type:complete len:138 (+),score=14.48 TRINITY_DN8150_c0_g1_i1:62-475(+)
MDPDGIDLNEIRRARAALSRAIDGRDPCGDGYLSLAERRLEESKYGRVTVHNTLLQEEARRAIREIQLDEAAKVLREKTMTPSRGSSPLQMPSPLSARGLPEGRDTLHRSYFADLETPSEDSLLDDEINRCRKLLLE